MSEPAYNFNKGRPHPLGATVCDAGTNFAVFSEHATGIEILLFDKHDDPAPVQTFSLDREVNRTFHFWHVFVEGLKPGMHYAYRVHGPQEPWKGHRFNPRKVLIDPYARGNTNNLWDRFTACGEEANLEKSLRSVVIDQRDYDWEGDLPLRRPMSESVIYELHVGGLTRDASSGVRNPGSFRAVVEKIPYLKELGVTAVELLPVFEFDDKEVIRVRDGVVMTNYWGYSTVSYFAPHRAYCIAPEEGAHLTEFRDMVKALHKAGIEVLLDVVFNHSNEGNHQGPTINFKGLDNSIYYHLVPGQEQYYMDYSGCGNTLNCNHPIVDKMIVECLEFWVSEMHVDGFRFDEGSILARGQDGAPMAYPPVLWDIELSETLMDAKIIAEAWDAAGLYQVGLFPGYRWAVWNGKYRDTMRRFVKGEPGILGEVASRLAGSADIFQPNGHLPINGVNFITCHDGFTLNDLVSYNEKHNESNGEGNNDGINDNLSWNCGTEGPASKEIEALRSRQVKNFAALLFMSQGVPMITMGDEVRRSQAGNNNAYCQDNATSWMDWRDRDRHPDVYRFFARLIAFRARHAVLQRSCFYSGALNRRGLKDVTWHGTTLDNPGWGDANGRALAFTLGDAGEGCDLHVMMNMHWQALEFELPQVEGRRWFRFVDTSLPAPHDVAENDFETAISGSSYRVNDRSVVILASNS